MDLAHIAYISAFIASFTELFPSLGMSYWLPRDMNNEFYDRVILRRVLAVIITWSIISYNLYKINKWKTIIALIFILISFDMRWKAEDHKYNYSGVFHFIGFVTIASIMSETCISCYNYTSVLVLLFGGSIIGKGRYADIETDILGRFIFSIGFYFFIHNLIRAST